MDKRPLTPEDLFAFRNFGDARLSPDGRSVAYVRQHHDREKEKSFTDIHLYNVETGQTRKLTNSGKDHSPRWSPDGGRISFTSDRSGKSQVWMIDPAGGEAWRLPTKEAPQGEAVWSPDGKKVFFASSAFSKADDWEPYPGAPEGDRARALDQADRALRPKDEKPKPDDVKPNDVKVITRLRYRMDGSGYYGDLRKHVFAVDVPADPPGEADLPATLVTAGDFDHSLPALTPDGKYAVLAAMRSDDSDYRQKSDLWLFEVESRKSFLLYDAPGPVSGPQVSPCGDYVAFLGHDQTRGVSTRTDLYMLPVAAFIEAARRGETPVPLTVRDASNLTARLDRTVGSAPGPEPRFGGMSSLIWDGSGLYFLLEDYGEAFVYCASPAGGGCPSCRTNPRWEVKRVFGAPGKGLGGLDVKAGTFVYQSSTPTAPEDIFLLKGGVETRITSENDELVESLAVGNCEKFRYVAKDGQELDGWLIYPRGYEPGKKYPTVLLVHGGPHGAYGSVFMFSAQLFASNGYAVAYCNPRGSSSYGQDFMAVIDGDWGEKDYGDVMACVDAVIERSVADPEKLFIHGWSYGGYMTVWAITQTDRFKAACAGACVANMHSDYGTTDIMWADEQEYGGKPWEKADLLLSRSAVSHVDKVATPILLLHGETDLRCPISQSEQFYIGLKRLGKTAVFVRYPDEFHGLKRHLHRIDRYKRMMAWFNYYLGDAKKSE